MGRGTREYFEILGATMADVARQLSAFLDREVIDKTGIEGKFDFRVNGSVEELFPRMRPPVEDPSVPVPRDDAGPGIFEALKQLGLKLESAKGPGRFLVIERAEKPTPN